MNRTLKQILYGGFYVFLILFFLWGFYNLSFAPAPTCSDGIQNQGETEIDCGGPCQSCDIANLKPLDIKEGIKKISFASKHSAFVTLSNLNSDYSGDFEYKLSLLSDSGAVVDEIYGTSYALPYEKDYIVHTSSNDFSTVKFEILGTEWNKLEDFSKPEVSNVKGSLTDNGVEVSGEVIGDSPVSYEEVRVIALFRDSSGFNELFFAQSVLDNFGPFDERSFSMKVSIDESLRDRVDLENTKYYITVNK